MKKVDEKSKDKSKKPFFARYLEGQELEQVQGGRRGPPYVTLKYPSDDDEYPTY
ncbi:MAG: microviridin/marinostatin family tricyclic proteinase inhibitor [Myxococcales bacterium]|nr:microviridin/marinostatin family tricyclic proteinase inhibitor [Myxococcales bacterium]MCB9718182.1 microviridin/marinostatin family tricyclic proteinase inhibitor [Myxococcales bacterium]